MLVFQRMEWSHNACVSYDPFPIRLCYPSCQLCLILGLLSRWERHRRVDEDDDDKPGMTSWERWWRDDKDKVMRRWQTMTRWSWQNDDHMKATMTTTRCRQGGWWWDEEPIVRRQKRWGGRWGWDKADIDDWTMTKEDSYVEGTRARWGRHQRDDEDNDDKPGMMRWEGWQRDVKDEMMKRWQRKNDDAGIMTKWRPDEGDNDNNGMPTETTMTRWGTIARQQGDEESEEDKMRPAKMTHCLT
jgi:hypothetical protein